MRTTRRFAESLPLAAWAGAVVAAAGLLVLLVVTAGLAAAGLLGGRTAPVLAGAAVVALTCGGAAALAGRRGVARLHGLERDALLRLSGTVPNGPVPPAPCRELRELGETLHALYRRVRVADEIAERHRRTAQAASAGMFELLSGLVAAEEGARGQLAAELHDTVAQTLMAARALLAGQREPPADDRSAELVADLVGEAEEQVRGVMARTRPPALRDGDLALAVANLCLDLQQRYGLQVRLAWPSRPRPLPLVVAVTTYRFFQEALLNVVKHADVDDAEATLDFDDGELLATVRDRGSGFDAGAVAPDRGRHVGLGLLRERARLAGGAIDVAARPGAGTELRLRLPLSTTGALLPVRAR